MASRDWAWLSQAGLGRTRQGNHDPEHLSEHSRRTRRDRRLYPKRMGVVDMVVSPLLLETLCWAVPMWIHRLRYSAPDYRAERARLCADHIAVHGDLIQYRAPRKGETGEAFNFLAEGLACGAYQPGGVTFMGQHWCTDHAACEAAERTADSG